MQVTTTLDLLRRGELAGATVLDLSGAGLESLPPELYGLADSLEILDLGRNALRDLPHDFARLHRLRVLFCSETALRVLPSVLGECAALRQIGCRAAGIEIVPPEAMPPGLRWLTLTGNRIAALPDGIGSCVGLQKLMLAGNCLTRLPEALAGAAGLELLRVAANRLDALPAFLFELPRLAWLAFAGNPAEGAVPKASLSAPMPPAPTPWASIVEEELLGEGASGEVRAARVVGPGSLRGARIAIKRFKGGMTSDGAPASEIAASLASGARPGLLGAAGRVCDHPDGAERLILPLLPESWRVLAAPPSLETCTRDVYDPAFAPSPHAVLRIARGIARAGAGLASMGLLHGDLYAHNIHWDGAEGDAVLGDFGAASWRPAEIAAHRLEVFDVLAWGILVGELLERVHPAETSPELAALRDAALRPRAAERPAFAEIVRVLS